MLRKISLCLLSWLLFSTPSYADNTQDVLANLLTLRRQETALINQRLPIAELESKLEVFVPVGESAQWQLLSENRRPLLAAGGSVYLVHLWATWCKPCEQEFPVLLEIWRSVTEDRKSPSRKSTQLLLVAEGDTPDGINNFRRRFPLLGTELPLYGDANSNLLGKLKSLAAEGDIGMPTTLLLDRCGVIRQAFVGSMKGRDKAVIAAISRLTVAHAGLKCAGGQERSQEP